MSRLNPNKLHVRFRPGTTPVDPVVPRRYTLTHSDRTHHLYLTIGSDYDTEQISGRYTRWMRDEVLAEWQQQEQDDAQRAEQVATYQLHVYVHVSGGRVIGSARHRFRVFQRELPLALQAIRTGDSWLHATHPQLDASEVVVHFASTQAKYNIVEPHGLSGDYQLTELLTVSPKRPVPNHRDPLLHDGGSKVGSQRSHRR